jgi:hypothetical protein
MYLYSGSIRISSVPYASKVPILCLKIDISAICDNSDGGTKKYRKSKKKSKKFRKKSRKFRK